MRIRHKPWIIKYNGVVYHFYCAVGNRQAIALATSKPVSIARSADDIESRFKDPPPSASPGSSGTGCGVRSPGGITADLEAMKAAGIGGPISSPSRTHKSRPVEPPVRQLTPSGGPWSGMP